MIHIHMNTEDYGYTQKVGFEPRVQNANSKCYALSETPWHWHGGHRSVYGRNVWIFIEVESLFTLCFFDLPPRDLRQLDITLWLRLISEHTFISQQLLTNQLIELSEDFLGIVRSLMAPMVIDTTTTPNPFLEYYANFVFEQVKQFLRQPLPYPTPLRYEMDFDWTLNIGTPPTNLGSSPHQSFDQNFHELDVIDLFFDRIATADTPPLFKFIQRVERSGTNESRGDLVYLKPKT